MRKDICMDASCGLALRTYREGNTVVVCVGGELDYATTPQLVSAIESAVDNNIRLCLVDCMEVTFIDSEALKALIQIQNRLLESGTSLRIRCCSRQVLRTLRMLGLENRFLLHNN